MTTYTQDIPHEVAYRARLGMSHVPEDRAGQILSGYSSKLASIREQFEEWGRIGGTSELVDEQFGRFRAGYRKRYTACLDAESRVMSSMIAGPANFPVRRMEKRNATVRRRYDDLERWHTRAMRAVNRTLCPGARPIMSGDDDAVTRLREKIAEEKAKQERDKLINKTIRNHAGKGREAIATALVEAVGLSPEVAAELVEDGRFAGWGVPSFTLKNRNANIRRMEQRLQVLERNKGAETVEIEGEAARFEDDPPSNRVRLYFPGKPSAEVRQALKSVGYRWAPSLSAWQAFRNSRAIEAGKKIAGV